MRAKRVDRKRHSKDCPRGDSEIGFLDPCTCGLSAERKVKREALKMKLKDEETWMKWVRNNTDPYGGACVAYAKRWAELMEAKGVEGLSDEAFARIAKDTSNEADTEGITGFMYGAAVHMLSESWVHGERLRVWHNAKYGQPEAKGTVNPALLWARDEDLSGVSR